MSDIDLQLPKVVGVSYKELTHYSGSSGGALFFFIRPMNWKPLPCWIYCAGADMRLVPPALQGVGLHIYIYI